LELELISGEWSENEPEPWMDAAALIGAQQPQRTRPSASLWMDRNHFQVVDRQGFEGCHPLQPAESRA